MEKLLCAMESLQETFHCTGTLSPLRANIRISIRYYQTEEIIIPGHATLKTQETQEFRKWYKPRAFKRSDAMISFVTPRKILLAIITMRLQTL